MKKRNCIGYAHAEEAYVLVCPFKLQWLYFEIVDYGFFMGIIETLFNLDIMPHYKGLFLSRILVYFTLLYYSEIMLQ